MGGSIGGKGRKLYLNNNKQKTPVKMNTKALHITCAVQKLGSGF